MTAQKRWTHTWSTFTGWMRRLRAERSVLAWRLRWIAVASAFAVAIFAAPPLHDLVIRRPSPRAFIIWNVGQGAWSTLSTEAECHHFDMGGENVKWAPIIAECAGKQNLVSFSHWDQDHISFARLAARRLPGLCAMDRPKGEASERKKDLLAALPNCTIGGGEPIRELSKDSDRPVFSRRSRQKNPNKNPTSNEESRVFEITGLAVLPGDSPIACEKQWSRRLGRGDKILNLGHHGSRTSTGTELLSRLSSVVMAVASSRRARYGHPHNEIAQRLKARGVALISTERWGTLRFEAPERTSQTSAPLPRHQ